MTEAEMKLTYGIEGYQEILEEIRDFIMDYDSYTEEILKEKLD